MARSDNIVMVKKPRPDELWCGRCERFKFGGLFNPSQRTKSDKSRRCIECQTAQSTETRKRLTPKTQPGDNWRGNNALFLR
jgi:hypothetical protein